MIWLKRALGQPQGRGELVKDAAGSRAGLRVDAVQATLPEVVTIQCGHIASDSSRALLKMEVGMERQPSRRVRN